MLTLYNKPEVLEKSSWHSYLDATLVPPSSIAWGKLSKCRNCPGWKEQNQAGSITWERQRGRTRRSVVSSPLLSSALPDTPGTRQLGFHAKTLRSSCSSRVRFAHGRRIQFSLFLQALDVENKVSAAGWVFVRWLPIPAPLPPFIPNPLPDGIPQPSPSLVSPLPPGIPSAQPFGEVPNPLQGSCLPLTVGKAHEPLPSPTFSALACICHLP